MQVHSSSEPAGWQVPRQSASVLQPRVGSTMQTLETQIAEPEHAAAPPPTAAEASFLPGGEGLTLTLINVPAFQALMDFQKSLMALDQVDGASVERFQEGDSRLLLQLKAPITASELAATLQRATGHNIAVEDSKPELMRLRLKVLPQ